MFYNVNANITSCVRIVQDRFNDTYNYKCVFDIVERDIVEGKHYIPSYDISLDINITANDNPDHNIQKGKQYQGLLAMTYDNLSYKGLAEFVIDAGEDAQWFPSTDHEWLSLRYTHTVKRMEIPRHVMYIDLALLILADDNKWHTQTIKRIYINQKT